jgi:hypothetical protein
MPIASTDIHYRLSGGSANTDPNASLGGAKSSTQITDNTLNNLWDNVSGDQSAAGLTEYRCIYIHNNHATLTLQTPVVWISALTASADDEVDIGIGSSAVNGTEQSIANEATAPTSVTFSRPTTKGTGLALGDLPATQHRAVWIRRTVNAGAAAYTSNSYTLRVEGDTAA